MLTSVLVRMLEIAGVGEDISGVEGTGVVDVVEGAILEGSIGVEVELNDKDPVEEVDESAGSEETDKPLPVETSVVF